MNKTNKNRELYTCEWGYIGDDTITIITKIPASEYDKDRRIEQCGSHSEYGFDYYGKLREAIACSIVPVNEILFVNIGKEDVKKEIKKEAMKRTIYNILKSIGEIFITLLLFAFVFCLCYIMPFWIHILNLLLAVSGSIIIAISIKVRDLYLKNLKEVKNEHLKTKTKSDKFVNKTLAR